MGGGREGGVAGEGDARVKRERSGRLREGLGWQWDGSACDVAREGKGHQGKRKELREICGRVSMAMERKGRKGMLRETKKKGSEGG